MSLPSSMADFVPCDRLLQKAYPLIQHVLLAALTGHCSCRLHVGFSVVVVLYSYIVKYAFV